MTLDPGQREFQGATRHTAKSLGLGNRGGGGLTDELGVPGREVRDALCGASAGDVEEVLVAPVKLLQGSGKVCDRAGVSEEALRCSKESAPHLQMPTEPAGGRAAGQPNPKPKIGQQANLWAACIKLDA